MAYDSHELGSAIARARRERGLTQADLADRLGVTRTTIIRLEQGAGVSVETALLALSECGHAVAVVPKFSRLTVGDANGG